LRPFTSVKIDKIDYKFLVRQIKAGLPTEIAKQ